MKLLVTFLSAAFFYSFLLPSPHVFSAEKNPQQEITAIAQRNWPPQFLPDEKTGKLDNALGRFPTTTQYKDIYEKWYGRPHPFWSVNRVIHVMGSLISLTIIGLLTWRYMSLVRLNRTLSEARDRFRTIIDDTDAGYFRLDSDGIYQQVNKAWLKMHGYASPAEVIGRHFTLTQMDVDLKKAQQNVTKLLSGERIPTGELTRRCQDGSIGYHTFSAHPVTRKGQVVGVEGFIIDRTDLKEAEQALRKSEEKHRLLFEYAGDAIFIYDSQSHLLAINPMACELLGYTHAELMAMTIDRVRTEKESLYGPDQIARVLAEGHLTFETVHRRKDGSTVPIEVNARRITWEDQPAIMSICRDITERKRGEEQVIRLQKAESLKRMAGAIAHHFNNQLTVVMGNLELTLDDLPPDAKNRQNLVAAMQAATRAAEVSGLMLTYLGQGIDRSQKIDLSEACRQNLPILEATLPQGIILQTDLLNPGPVVLANPSQLQTLLLHLLTNGTEALAEQEGRVRLATGIVQANVLPKGFTMPGEWRPRADSYAFLEVTDSGCGMSTEEMEKLFDPFYTTKFTGRGLGLSVVLGLVKAWDGAISVLSRKDRGSTFRVLLPLCIEEIPMQALAMDKSPDLEHEGFVLLVDDQPDVREMGKAMLKRLGYASLSAEYGTEAVVLLQQHRGMVRCVITDLSMPGMDGWETIAALRKIQPDLPAILTSGFEESEVMGQDNQEHPVIFLHKPYTMIELQNALSRSIQDTRPGSC